MFGKTFAILPSSIITHFHLKLTLYLVMMMTIFDNLIDENATLLEQNKQDILNKKTSLEDVHTRQNVCPIIRFRPV